MKRILNNRLTVVSLFIGLLMLSTLLSFQPPKVAEQRPNIIFILADDMGFSDIGCYGGEVSTPNLDQLAANGIKLRSFYNNARCCPTRASLLTGQYPHTAGMGLMVTMPNAPIQPGSYQGFLDDRYPTIAERLKPAGYSTYMVGKWHVGERRQHWPLTRGFDRYFGLISGASSYYEIIPAEKGKRFIVEDDKEFTPPADGFYMTDAFTDHAVQYLNEQKQQQADKPFFLYVAYTAPHFPLHAYESDIAKYEKLYAQGWDVIRANRYQRMQKLGYADKRYPLTPRPADIPDWNTVTDKAQWVRKMAVYAAMIDRMDQNIGRLIKTLKANGQYENTLIVFMSDNGSSNENMESRKLNDPNKKIGERGSYVTYDTPWANVSNTPFRKYKRFLHEGGMITPCIMQWPRGIRPKAGYVEGVGHIMDLVPTSLELAGLPTNDLSGNPLPGKSLSYLWGTNKAVSRTYCWEHEGNKAIRKADWKLEKDTEDADWELYNLKTDPCEMNNLAQQKPQLVAELRTEFDAWAQKVGVRERTGGKSE
ncbi:MULTISPECIES: arylsulfatase [unclassified Spirosoma]|uniref:arylsulfatase n=1 Tax=unclassified Spirosoma TaxID=2621999 RepID=UPI00095C0514|nr:MULTISPECIES: arylsulfatase [unclassified Spirosoma]MBN8821622.1 arylsulfatase [Spirosoma sp.]OJW78388.1 MAG: sulfatase [Spirosoma sp. 48-14]